MLIYVCRFSTDQVCINECPFIFNIFTYIAVVPSIYIYNNIGIYVCN